MKKKRVPASIDKDIHQKIKHLLKTHPEMEYKKISKFVNKTLEEKLEDIETELIMKMIRNSGVETFIMDVKILRSRVQQLEKFVDEKFLKMWALHRQMEEEWQGEGEIGKLAKEYEKNDPKGFVKIMERVYEELSTPKRKHTHGVYTSKKK